VRGTKLRSLAALAIGLVTLGGILYVASTVDGRAPTIERIELTHHLSADDGIALTTTSVEVVFSEAVDHGSAEAAFSIEPITDGSFSWSGDTLTFTPVVRLPLETDFAVTVAPGVRDPAGNEMAQASQLAFVTVGHPTVVASQPEPDADEVPLASPIVLDFSTLMDTASVEEALTISPAVELTATWSGERLTLTPVDRLVEGTIYTVGLSEAARDSAGTPLERPYALSFQAVRSGLTATTQFPEDGTEGISVSSPIALIFDRDLDADTVDSDRFTIEPNVSGSLAATAIPGAAGLREPGVRLLRFEPSSPLQPNTTYQITLDPGLTGTDGSALAGPISWRFTTGSPLPTLSNQVVFVSDRSGIANLWTMNPDGTGQQQLSAELSAVSAYAVAPDGRTFVVGDGATLVRQRADGTGRQLLTPDGVLEVDATYSPNGSDIAFARIDRDTGVGLGLWTRASAGGDARRLELAAELGAATPTPQDPAAVPPVLRAPRYSPDGAALAFVDMRGRVGVLELLNGRLTTAPFAAVSPPVWLPQAEGVLLAGSPAGALEPTPIGQPIPLLDPGALQLGSFELGALRIARLDRGAATVDLLDQPPGASRPVAGQDGRYLFILVQPGAPQAGGTLWLASAGGASARQLGDGDGSVTSAGFGPGSRDVAAAHVGDGIWLVNAITGRSRQLSEDGWLPRWLP
jgi:hypothetical protein